jgi:hypothetical protein
MFILQTNNEGRSVFEKDPEHREQMTRDMVHLVREVASEQFPLTIDISRLGKPTKSQKGGFSFLRRG